VRPRRGASWADRGCYTRPQTRRHLPQDLNQAYYTTELKNIFHCYLSLLTYFCVTIQEQQTAFSLRASNGNNLNFKNPCTLDRAKCYSWTVQNELAESLLSETRASNDARGRKGLLIYALYRQIYALPRQSYALPRQTYALPRRVYVLSRQIYALPRHIYALSRQSYALPRQIYAKLDKFVLYQDRFMLYLDKFMPF